MWVDTLSNVVSPVVERTRDIDEPGTADVALLAEAGSFPLLDVAAEASNMIPAVQDDMEVWSTCFNAGQVPVRGRPFSRLKITSLSV